jgi:hypothetical protein
MPKKKTKRKVQLTSGVNLETCPLIRRVVILMSEANDTA